MKTKFNGIVLLIVVVSSSWCCDEKILEINNKVNITGETSSLPAGTVAYYVSTSGADSNDGLSEATPFKTLSKAASMITGGGQAILLKRGDQWSGERIQLSGKQGTPESPVVIAAYGSGPKPIINGN